MNYDKLIALIMALFDILLLIANRRKAFFFREEELISRILICQSRKIF